MKSETLKRAQDKAAAQVPERDWNNTSKRSRQMWRFLFGLIRALNRERKP